MTASKHSHDCGISMVTSMITNMVKTCTGAGVLLRAPVWKSKQSIHITVEYLTAGKEKRNSGILCSFFNPVIRIYGYFNPGDLKLRNHVNLFYFLLFSLKPDIFSDVLVIFLDDSVSAVGIFHRYHLTI